MNKLRFNRNNKNIKDGKYITKYFLVITSISL